MSGHAAYAIFSCRLLARCSIWQHPRCARLCYYLPAQVYLFHLLSQLKELSIRSAIIFASTCKVLTLIVALFRAAHCWAPCLYAVDSGVRMLLP